MIQKLELENYRCFLNHTVNFKKNNIVVGENNAGKSTIVEALRIISIISLRYKSIRFSPSPNWLDLPVWSKGIKPSLDEYDFNFESVFHRYGNPPAKLTATFSNGTKIIVYIYNDDNVFALIKDENGKIITSKSEAKNIHIPKILILPQITALKLKEGKLVDEYVHRAIYSNLSSQHFRNQLLLYPEQFETFKQLLRETWDGCWIESLEKSDEPVNPIISLLVRDNDFVAEIGWMGHGLQMWIQIMWFLSFASPEDVVILDEPDVYMHADLQRKIIRILMKKDFLQTIVTTHSVEIISEVNAENILIVDKTKYLSKFANSTPSVQKLIDGIGCSHNIQLTRFWTCKKCLLVEGEDIDILKHFQAILFPYSENPLETLPHMSVGGWTGLKYAIGTSLMLKNSAGELVNTYCILDRDYYTEDQIQEAYKEAENKDLKLHIWNRKEIENYLIIPEAICRVIENRAKDEIKISISEIREAIDGICNELYYDIFDNMSNEFRKYNRKEQEKANEKTRTLMDSHWSSLNEKLKLVPGKVVISKLSKWSKASYGISFSAGTIVREIKKEEINPEIKSIIESIEKNVDF